MSRLLIVNPFASGVDEHRLTTAAGEASEIAGSAGDVDAIYVLGGDGTYNEVLNGVRVDVPLGFLPGGGTSVLPRALGLSRDPVKAAKRVAEGRTRRVGLGRVNGRRFGFNAGLGLDAELLGAGLGRGGVEVGAGADLEAAEQRREGEVGGGDVAAADDADAELCL